MIEDSLLKRGPASPGARHYPEELLDPAAFQERLRDARARRAIALATRAATGGGGAPAPTRATPPLFPAPAGALETEAPIFVPPFARQGAAEPLGDGAPASPVRSPRPPAAAPRIEVTPGGAPAPVWAALAPLAPALRHHAQALGARMTPPAALAPALGVATAFARRHVVPIVASFFVAGALFGAVGVMLAPGGETAPEPTRRAAVEPAPMPVALPEVTSTGPAEDPGARPTVAPPAAPAILAAATTPLPVTMPDPEPLAPDPETGDTLAAPEPDQMPSPEPDALPIPAPPPAALTREYLAARPLPRPAVIRAAAPAAETPAAYPGTRVVINVPAGKPAENPDATEAMILAAGFPRVEQARTKAEMSANQVRYFHAADAETARALATLTGAIARDFTTHTPPPKKGYLELWLAGTAPRQAQAAPAAEAQILGILRDRAARN